MRSPARVDVLTFGCRLNLVESETMRRLALASGHRDLTIVNSCAVTAEASRQAGQAIRRARRMHPHGRLVVTGCASEVARSTFAAMTEVDAIVGNRDKTSPAAWRIEDGALATPVPGPLDFSPQAEGAHTRGFVEVQNGCDHRCTFCIIPFGRGASRSVPPEAVIARARTLVDGGAREIVLTGVDLTSYGADLTQCDTLGTLARRLLRAFPELARLRLSSIDCVEADATLLDVLASEPRLMPHLHLSLQSGCDLILKRMKRRHGRRDAVDFCHTLRRIRPDIVFGADLIAGFPTETESMFAATADLVDDCGLTSVHVFPYSPRPGTPATRMPQVHPEIVRDRAQRLRARGEARTRLHLEAQIGRRLDVLTERGGKARTPQFIPVRLVEPAAPGLLQPAVISGHDGRALLGSLDPAACAPGR